MSSRRSRSLTNPERPRGGRWRRPAWKDPRMAGGVEARRVATGLVIASVGEASKGLISGPSTGVEVKVPEGSLAAVLSAVGQEGALVLVPTGQEAPAEKAS